MALRMSGDKAAFYNCKLFGFQDTVCDDRHRHLFKDCLIQGTVDFIFGSGKSLYLVNIINFIERLYLYLSMWKKFQLRNMSRNQNSKPWAEFFFSPEL